jgi:hypothetical protein
LLEDFGGVSTLLEVGSDTGPFRQVVGGVEVQFNLVGLDRAPAMVREARRKFSFTGFGAGRCRTASFPFRTEAVDVVVFITTLEFVGDTTAVLGEAVRVARRGIAAVVLNLYSLGGLSRRWGGSLLSQARGYSLCRLRRQLQKAARARLQMTYWSSTLFSERAVASQGKTPARRRSWYCRKSNRLTRVERSGPRLGFNLSHAMIAENPLLIFQPSNVY